MALIEIHFIKRAPRWNLQSVSGLIFMPEELKGSLKSIYIN